MTKMIIHLALCVLSTLLSCKVSNADLSQRKAATWNLQGSSDVTSSKWSCCIKPLISGSNHVSVLSLQEAGTPPSSAIKQGPLGNRLIDPHDLKLEVLEYQWNQGTSERPDLRWIYYTHNDLGANRVNLAIVTDTRPDHVLLFRPPGRYDSVRPILGVQFGKDNYFTIHAGASGGGDAAAIVSNIVNYFISEQQYDHQFMILGDFNKSPDDLRRSLNRQYPDVLRQVGIYNLDAPTHNSNRILDYAVIGRFTDPPTKFPISVEMTFGRQRASDHKPVTFTVTLK